MNEKSIKCKDCGKVFVITEKEQEWYKSKGFEEPKRCKDCRNTRKSKGGK